MTQIARKKPRLFQAGSEMRLKAAILLLHSILGSVLQRVSAFSKMTARPRNGFAVRQKKLLKRSICMDASCRMAGAFQSICGRREFGSHALLPLGFRRTRCACRDAIERRWWITDAGHGGPAIC